MIPPAPPPAFISKTHHNHLHLATVPPSSEVFIDVHRRASIAAIRDKRSDFIHAHDVVAGDGIVSCDDVVAIPVAISVKCCGHR
ncbi:hypothetical protein E3N88_21048 [Mikania micrantha]|uniref:Uncharacterized protein n=1 Tax=Mikania micrantha TaxID=192012 RepID=A0A5N6NL96_9ASTR|nr:hypothetical protein E3N88_21048 [Mikania micrantha]